MPYLVSVDGTHALVETLCSGPITTITCIGAMDDRVRLLPIRQQAIGRSNRRDDALQCLLAAPAS